MATNFPHGIDSGYTNPTNENHLGDSLVLHSTQHANANDAIYALENKVGIDFSNVNTSLDYILRFLLVTQTQHPNGGYAETSYVNNQFPIISNVIWYTDATKTIKLVELALSYGSIKILPTTETLKLFDGTSLNVVKRTITDTITYNKVFEVSRTRIIS